MLKVAKCVSVTNAKCELLAVEAQDLPQEIDEKKFFTLLQQTLKKLNYEHQPVIVCLPRSQATCRYIKIPATSEREIEGIASLQASRYLPYSANELVTGFDLVSTSPDGFSYINLIIVQKNIVARFVKVFKELKSPRLNIVLSSYGLFNLYNAFEPNLAAPAMVIDIDHQQAEMAVVSSKKMLFSRAIKLNRVVSDWMSLLFEEIRKTQDTYLESVSQEPLSRIALVGAGGVLEELKAALEEKFSLPVDILGLGARINMAENLSKSVSSSPYSFAGFAGLCLKETGESLNLLPQEMKNEARKWGERTKALKAAAFALAIVLTLGLGVARHLDNKGMFLARLKHELGRISKQAKPLEDIERRFGLMEARALIKPSCLDILYELHQIVPQQLSLVTLSYEENKQVVLRGQAPELNSVFAFVEQMEQSSVFKAFHIKVRYATKKRGPSGDLVDFEIECQKK